MATLEDIRKNLTIKIRELELELGDKSIKNDFGQRHDFYKRKDGVDNGKRKEN